MLESLMEEVNRLFPDKGLLSLDEVCKLLECERHTVYNWTKRSKPKKRPPRIIVGKSIRFPKKDFVIWLVNEQSAVGRRQ